MQRVPLDGGFALFDSAVGRCGMAWRGASIIGLQLPEQDDPATRARIVREHAIIAERDPPMFVCDAIRRVEDMLNGGPDRLDSIPLDMTNLPPFHRRVYDVVRAIPPGRTLTYGEVAVRVGSPGAARAVGQALGRNPFAIIVPCHRVLAAGGKSGGFSAHGGAVTKLRLLALERSDLFSDDPSDPPARMRTGPSD